MEKIVVHTLILIVVVGVVIAFMFVVSPPDRTHPIVGTWEARQMITRYANGTVDQEPVTGPITFNQDGTGSYIEEPFKWEDIGGNMIRTRDEYDVIVYEYRITDNELRLIVRDPDKTITMVFFRV